MPKSAFEAFFLPAEPGSRFALFHPAQGLRLRGAVLYVHPFGEEMNKSRRMAALQAKAFAAAGYAVLQIDLYGCGDSSGDFSDARWEVWKRDLVFAADWLATRVEGPLHLWGLRLGATLALDSWRDAPKRFASAVLWQPVIVGNAFMTQFLRLAVAGEALRDGEKVTTDMLRAQLRLGEFVEVAGYELAPALVAAIDEVSVADWSIPAAAVSWLEVRSSVSGEPSPAAARQLEAWRARSVAARYEAIVGDPFWMTQEITEVEALISATTSFLDPSRR